MERDEELVGVESYSNHDVGGIRPIGDKIFTLS